MSIMNVIRKNYQAGTYAPGMEAEFLKPFGETISDFTVSELRQPLDISAISPKVSKMSPLVQEALQRQASQAGLGNIQFDPQTGEVTGVGAGTGVASYEPFLQAAQASAGPDAYKSYMSPYQTEVLQATENLLAEQRAAGRQSISDQAYTAGAFGGGREGIQRAELQRATQANIGQSLATGFGQAVGAAQQQQAMQTQAGMQGGQLLGALGGQQQAMQQADIASLLQAGGIQQQLGQQALEASRATEMARAYEPYQRLEFLKGIMTNLPTSQSAVTATTAPGSNPLAQAVGTGIGAYAAYNLGQRRV